MRTLQDADTTRAEAPDVVGWNAERVYVEVLAERWARLVGADAGNAIGVLFADRAVLRSGAGGIGKAAREIWCEPKAGVVERNSRDAPAADNGINDTVARTEEVLTAANGQIVN